MESQLDLFETTAEGDGAWGQLSEEARKEATELMARLVVAYAALLAGEVRDDR